MQSKVAEIVIDLVAFSNGWAVSFTVDEEEALYKYDANAHYPDLEP